ncbi:BH3-interacting domain death agonist [Rhinophrynus dorsalis]
MSVDVDLIFLSFLECYQCQNIEFKNELSCLVQKVRPTEGDLQPDGNLSFRSVELMSSVEGEQEVDADLCRRIGAQLAELGDKLEREGRIKQEVVDSLVDAVLNNSFTEERFSADINSLLGNLPPGVDQEKALIFFLSTLFQRFSADINSLLGNLPPGVDQEKASVTIAMILTKLAATNVPPLLESCYRATRGFIQRKYMACLQRLTGQR